MIIVLRESLKKKKMMKWLYCKCFNKKKAMKAQFWNDGPVFRNGRKGSINALLHARFSTVPFWGQNRESFHFRSIWMLTTSWQIFFYFKSTNCFHLTRIKAFQSDIWVVITGILLLSYQCPHHVWFFLASVTLMDIWGCFLCLFWRDIIIGGENDQH